MSSLSAREPLTPPQPPTDVNATDDDGPPPAVFPARMSSRLRRWLRTLQRNPSLEEKAMRERRERLLEDLSRAVAEAPDDVPIKSIVERLNRHRDD